LSGSVIMAAFSWWDALSRETEGFEYETGNALVGAVCCGTNWLVLIVVDCLALGVAASAPQHVKHTPENGES
jgi:hypothetical protein